MDFLQTKQTAKVIRFPNIPVKLSATFPQSTPIVDAMTKKFSYLNQVSSYQSQFDWQPFRELELRTQESKVRGGFLFRTPIRLANHHSACQQCLYSFEIDTYGRGCIHNCVYCYAKAQLTVHGFWNNPFPAPVDIVRIRSIFYKVFETHKYSKWRSLLEKRIPLRLGSMSDCFMWMDKKYRVTLELLRILNHYNYPYVIFTHSDLVAKDEYLKALNPKLCSVQFSICSLNDELNRKIEPGSPSAARRLKALSILNREGVWSSVRINPIFPIYPDGYYTNPNFPSREQAPKFDYFSFDMVDEIAKSGCRALLAGFGRFSAYSLSQVEKVTGHYIRSFYNDSVRKSARDYHFSDLEIRYYYEKLFSLCKNNGIQFSTCYIGNGETHFWKHRDLWHDKSDCCNIRGQVPGFKASCREIPFDLRMKFANSKKSTPNDKDNLHTSLDY